MARGTAPRNPWRWRTAVCLTVIFHAVSATDCLATDLDEDMSQAARCCLMQWTLIFDIGLGVIGAFVPVMIVMGMAIWP